MSQPAFHDVLKPIGDGAASAVAHPRLGGVFPVFGSSNTLVSAAQLTQSGYILIRDADMRFVVKAAMPAGLAVAVAPITQASSISFSDQASSISFSEQASSISFSEQASSISFSEQASSISFSEQDKMLTRTLQALKKIGERVKARRTGPVQVLSKIANDWQLSHAELAGLLAYPNSQSAADLLDGRASLRNPDREDRVRLLYRIYRVLSSFFPDVARQQAWLRATNPNLRNKSPLEFMLERRIPGMISVQNLVERFAGR
jgi:hypothetical protein